MGGGTAWNMKSNLWKQIDRENAASYWLYFRDILAIHGHMNVKLDYDCRFSERAKCEEDWP
jgi:hypothetical protein